MILKWCLHCYVFRFYNTQRYTITLKHIKNNCLVLNCTHIFLQVSQTINSLRSSDLLNKIRLFLMKVLKLT